ncbi:MAG: hypothetical protein NC409_14165 [Clostridium sp.]|nr:hypothetical protein [Clostridium sp.]
MVTIFDGIQKMTKEQLCYEVALLEQVTVSGYARTVAGKAKKTSVQMANRVTALVAKKQFTEPEAPTLAEQVVISQESLMSKGEEELRLLIKGNLCKRLESLGVENTAAMSEERLSALIITKAGEALSEVPDTTMILRKAELIADKNKRQRPEDFEDTILPGRLDREVLAHVTAAAVRAYDGKLAPTLNSLPDYRSGEALLRYLDEEEHLSALTAGSAEWKNEQTSLRNAAQAYEDQMRTQESERRSLEEKEEALLAKEGSPAEKDTYESMLNETRTLMEDCARRQQEFEEEYRVKKEELNRLEQKNTEGERQLQELLAVRTERLEENWRKAYPRFGFRDGVAAYAAREFCYDELIALEEAFAELALAENAENLDEPATEKKEYCSCTFYAETGYAGRIAYRAGEDGILILQVQKSRGKEKKGS